MSGSTVLTPNAIDTTLIEDGQAAGSITPSDLRQAFDSVSGLPIGTAQTAGYTFVATDRGTLVTYTSSSAGTFTVPANVFQAGSIVAYRSMGTGQLTIAAGSGFTLNIPSNLTATPVQYATGFVHIVTSTSGVLC